MPPQTLPLADVKRHLDICHDTLCRTQAWSQRTRRAGIVAGLVAGRVGAREVEAVADLFQCLTEAGHLLHQLASESLESCSNGSQEANLAVCELSERMHALARLMEAVESLTRITQAADATKTAKEVG